MKIYEHLCGSIIACDPVGKVSLENCLSRGATFEPEERPASGSFYSTSSSGRPQGSLANFQKRQVANACEYLRLHSEHKPLIFVATTSPNWGDTIFKPRISDLVHNLTNGYGMRGFVWVKEFAGNGAPHFHFVADLPFVDPVKLSLYWSGLFGFKARNSIRLGSKPDKFGRRIFHLSSRSHAWYIGKYLGKSFAPGSGGSHHGPRFRIQRDVARESGPIVYESTFTKPDPIRQTILTSSGYRELEIPQPFERRFFSSEGKEFNPNLYSWKRHPIHSVYFGRPKRPNNSRRQPYSGDSESSATRSKKRPGSLSIIFDPSSQCPGDKPLSS